MSLLDVIKKGEQLAKLEAALAARGITREDIFTLVQNGLSIEQINDYVASKAPVTPVASETVEAEVEEVVEEPVKRKTVVVAAVEANRKAKAEGKSPEEVKEAVQVAVDEEVKLMKEEGVIMKKEEKVKLTWKEKVEVKVAPKLFKWGYRSSIIAEDVTHATGKGIEKTGKFVQDKVAPKVGDAVLETSILAAKGTGLIVNADLDEQATKVREEVKARREEKFSKENAEVKALTEQVAQSQAQVNKLIEMLEGQMKK